MNTADFDSLMDNIADSGDEIVSVNSLLECGRIFFKKTVTCNKITLGTNIEV